MEDLRSASALLELHRQAVEKGIATDSAAGELEIFSFAVRSRLRGHKPGALFMRLIRGRHTERITQTDEDAAAQMLREHRNGPDRRASDGGGERPMASAHREPGSDGAFVEACLQAAKAQGLEDPYPIARQLQDWTEERWNSAYLAYCTGQSMSWLGDMPEGIGGIEFVLWFTAKMARACWNTNCSMQFDGNSSLPSRHACSGPSGFQLHCKFNRCDFMDPRNPSTPVSPWERIGTKKDCNLGR